VQHANNTSLPDTIHHIAIQVNNIQRAIEWYTNNFHVEVSYQDDTWAMLQFKNINLALVIPEQHPPYITIESPDADQFGVLTKHRDGTESIYITDPEDNVLEVMKQT
jgi:catechol 2,3-dioxygenase-like lactoylglutathione lyase family enzyme